jgi:hypothetical protein
MIYYTPIEIRDFVFGQSGHLLYVILPETFEEYWKNIDFRSRNNYRKAKKNGFQVKREFKPNSKEILAIWNSWQMKQGRILNKKYHGLKLDEYSLQSEWPIEDYSNLNDKDHYFAFYSCFDNESMKAYLEVLCSEGNCVVHSTMGHHDYLNKGIMKFLFLEVLKECINNKMKRFYYGDMAFLVDTRKHFNKELGIMNFGG